MPLTLFLAAPGRYGRLCAPRSFNALARPASRVLPDRASVTVTRWRAGTDIGIGAGKHFLTSNLPTHFDPSQSDSSPHQDSTSSDAFLRQDKLERPGNLRASTQRERGNPSSLAFIDKSGRSSRQQKQHRPSPNTYVLRIADYYQPSLYYTEPSSKIDLSYNNLRAWEEERRGQSPKKLLELRLDPIDLSVQSILGSYIYNDPISEEERRAKSLRGLVDARLDPTDTYTSLQFILARFINHVGLDAIIQGDASYDFPAADLSFLRKKGYDREDVAKWALVVLSRNPDIAAQHFNSPGRSYPLFLLLFFLRRTRISMDSLRIVLAELKRYGLQNISDIKKTDSPVLDPTSFSILIVRLVRHARVISPTALPEIARLMASKMETLRGIFPKPGPETANFVFFCNRFLSLLSRAPSIQPIISSTLQETAQFTVLRAMSEHEPPITVTQEGYRALARVQLAHTKTYSEQEWALLKSKAWPPWKVNRTAMDEDKGVEAGVSRAGLVLQQMYAAGYPPEAWEATATIYAGWDTDRSPTIQTRQNMANVPIRVRRGEISAHVRLKFEISQWAARVTATRTRREAWACFLAYEQTGLPAHQDVYRAMFMKIRHREVPETASAGHDAGHSQSSANPAVFPGDGREVFPEPLSMHETIFISEPVPSYEELLNRMTAQDVNVSGRTLAFLIKRTTSRLLGLRTLRRFEASYDGAIRRLLNGSVSNKTDVAKLPGYLLVEILNFFCRFKFVPRYEPLRELQSILKLPHNHPLNYVYHILVRCHLDYIPAWLLLVRSINTDRMWPEGGSISSRLHRWRLLRQILAQEPVVFPEANDELFQIICESLQKMVIGYSGTPNALVSKDVLIAQNARYIRSLFASFTRPSVVRKGPRRVLPVIPSPAAIHAYVRALGLLRDFEGLYSLASWIKTFHVLLLQRADTQAKGRARLRDALVAMRVFLERSWLTADRQDEHDPATNDLLELVREEIERALDLGGWPTDDEVDRYVRQPSARIPSTRNLQQRRVF